LENTQFSTEISLYLRKRSWVTIECYWAIIFSNEHLAAMNMISYSWWPWPFEGHCKWTTINFRKISISL